MDTMSETMKCATEKYLKKEKLLYHELKHDISDYNKKHIFLLCSRPMM